MMRDDDLPSGRAGVEILDDPIELTCESSRRIEAIGIKGDEMHVAIIE